LMRSVGISCCPCAPRCSIRRRSGRNTAKGYYAVGTLPGPARLRPSAR
jgi:hypothetical protein